MTENLFLQWLTFFDESVGPDVVRPLVLIMDGCSSHVSEEIALRAEELDVIK